MREFRSERLFGVSFAILLALLGYLRQGARGWLLGAAALFLVAALAKPMVLSKPRVLWIRFGELLERAVSPIVLAVIFFVVMTPIGLLMRAFGRQPMELDFDPSKESYWVRRERQPDPENGFRHQF